MPGHQVRITMLVCATVAWLAFLELYDETSSGTLQDSNRYLRPDTEVLESVRSQLETEGIWLEGAFKPCLDGINAGMGSDEIFSTVKAVFPGPSGNFRTNSHYEFIMYSIGIRAIENSRAVTAELSYELGDLRYPDLFLTRTLRLSREFCNLKFKEMK